MATPQKKTEPERRYRVLVGCDVGNGYHEPGEVIDHIPPKQVQAWLDEGVVELYTGDDKDAA